MAVRDTGEVGDTGSWWQSPALLGGTAVTLAAALTVVFW
jgi:hypothetical protein